MRTTDLLRIPRRQWHGRLLERCLGLPGAAKLQRIGRKRYHARIRSGERQGLIEEVLLHEAGAEFQSALEQWSREPGSAMVEPPVNDGLPVLSRRCSVVINTVDRAADLTITLEALKSHWDERDELIVVLGPTGDSSEEVIRRSEMPCQLIRCPVRNLAVSRNLGWRAAGGVMIAFIDDDASPQDGWLDRLLDALERDPEVGVSAGYVLDGQGQRFLNRHVVADTLGRAFGFDDAAAADAKIREIGVHRGFPTAMGCNMAFRRSILAEVGGFDPFYQYFLEETDVIRRVLSAGYRCEVSPESRVLHRLGGNLARKPSFDVDTRIVVIRSQIHYIGKFGKTTFTPEEIESCVWERALLDLEKIAWDSCFSGVARDACADLQGRYLRAVANEFRLDSPPDSSSLAEPSPITNHAS